MSRKLSFLPGVVLLALCAARASAITYGITFTSTDGVGSGGPTTGTITLTDADVAARSATPNVTAFSAKTFTFSGPAANATYDAGGNVFSLGLSDTNGLHTLVLHGNAAAPVAGTWDLDSVQVPGQKDDFGTYAITPVPEPAAGAAAFVGASGVLLLTRVRGRGRLPCRTGAEASARVST
jgi:hypothetical protein